MTKAIIIIHGMGEQKQGYSRNFQTLLSTEFGTISRGASTLIFEEVWWANILDIREQILFNNLNGTNLKWRWLRHKVISYLGDAIGYQNTKNKADSYNNIHQQVMNAYNSLTKNEEVDEIYFLAHSLGAVIISDFIYDNQQQNIQINFKKLLTFGTTLPLWTLRYATFNSTISFKGEQQWINMYNKNDILGYPLANTSPVYHNLTKVGYLKDIPIKVGNIFTSWNPCCHNKYWEDSNFIKSIATELK